MTDKMHTCELENTYTPAHTQNTKDTEWERILKSRPLQLHKTSFMKADEYTVKKNCNIKVVYCVFYSFVLRISLSSHK